MTVPKAPAALFLLQPRTLLTLSSFSSSSSNPANSTFPSLTYLPACHTGLEAHHVLTDSPQPSAPEGSLTVSLKLQNVSGFWLEDQRPSPCKPSCWGEYPWLWSLAAAPPAPHATLLQPQALVQPWKPLHWLEHSGKAFLELSVWLTPTAMRLPEMSPSRGGPHRLPCQSCSRSPVLLGPFQGVTPPTLQFLHCSQPL